MAVSPRETRKHNLFCLDAGLALLGEDLEPRRSVRICVEEGRIASIEAGRATSLVVIPGLVNSHIHVLDYGLGGLVTRAGSPRELLEWPNGLKARGIRLAYCRILSSLPRLFDRLRRMGYVAAVAFIEGSGGLCRLVAEVAASRGLRVLTYGRSGDVRELEGCDGLGTPVLLGRWARVAAEASRLGLRVAAHVSETPEQALQDDYIAALALKLEHVVHLTHAPCEAHRLLAEVGVLPVYAPLANRIHWGVEPAPCAPRFALGGDNAGWCPQSPWELMRWAFYELRGRGLDARSAALRALKAVSVWPLSHFLGVRGIVEGERAALTILHAPEVVNAVDPVAALVLTGDASLVVDAISPL